MKVPRRRRTDVAPRSARGQETLAVVLGAAAQLASTDGLEQLSMSRLATAAGMSKSGLYAHFDSKEELQLATIEHFCSTFAGEVLRDPPDDLSALLERWLGFYERKAFPGGCFLIVAAVAFANRPGRVQEALAKAVDGDLAVLETAVGQARAAGEIHAKGDERQIAFELHSILMSAHALFQITQDPAVFTNARTAIGRLVG